MSDDKESSARHIIQSLLVNVAIAIVNCSIQIAPASRMADFPAFVSEHSSAPLGRLERPPRTRLG